MEGDNEIRGMLKTLTGQIREHAEKVDRHTTKPVLADLNAFGTLYVMLERATGLKAADSNGLSDPYARLTIGGTSHKSKTIRKTLNPMWRETFEYAGRLGTLIDESLMLKMFDYDLTSRDDSLGNATFDLSGKGNFSNGVHKDFSEDLEQSDGSTMGTVHLQVWWLPNLDDDSRSSSPSLFNRQRTRTDLSSMGGSITATCADVKHFWKQLKKRIWKHIRPATLMRTFPIMHPDGKFRSGWNVCLAFFIIYCGMAVPLEIGFESDMVRADTSEAPLHLPLYPSAFASPYPSVALSPFAHPPLPLASSRSGGRHVQGPRAR